MSLIDKIKDLWSSEKTGSQISKTELSETNEMKSILSTNEIRDGDSLVEKTKDFLAGTVDEVKEQSAQIWDQVKEKASDLNDATKEYREKLAEKANEALEKMDEFVESTLEKANKQQEEERLKDANQDGFADKPIDFGKSVSEDKNDFFKKAEQWLEKNDSTLKTNANTPEDAIKSNHNKVINPLELPKDPE